MNSKHVLGGSALIGASACFLWLLFGQTGEQYEPRVTSADKVYEAPDEVTDDLWVILLPEADRKEQASETPFESARGDFELLNVAAGFGRGAVDEDLKNAIEGAIIGSPDSLRVLQSYFDAVGGDEVTLTARAQAVIDGLRGSDIANSFTALAEATTNVFNAASTSLWSGYVMPTHFDPAFALSFGARGYDFGSDLNADGGQDQPYSNFIRVAPNSGFVAGDAVQPIRTSSKSLLGDGLAGVTSFDAEMANGEYTVYVLASGESGIAPTAAFGSRTFIESDTPVRRVDLTDDSNKSAQVLLTAFGASSHIGDPQIVAASLDDEADGYVLRLRAIVEDGVVQIRFAPGQVPTYISAIIIESADPILEARLAELVSALLEDAPTPAPASGDAGTATDFTGSSSGGTSTSGGSSSSGGSGSSSTGTGVTAAWGVEFEHQFAAPFSGFIAYRGHYVEDSRNKDDCCEYNDNEIVSHALLVGFRVDLNTESLLQRDRTGAGTFNLPDLHRAYAWPDEL